MIARFRHRGLQQFFETGPKRSIQATQANRIRLILGRLNASVQVQDMNLPGLHLHELLAGEKELGLYV